MPDATEPVRVARSVPEGSVVITPAQMYEELRAVHELVRDLSGKVDPALADLRRVADDHESRLRGIEKRVWLACGAALFFAGPLGALASRIAG